MSFLNQKRGQQDPIFYRYIGSENDRRTQDDGTALLFIHTPPI